MVMAMGNDVLDCSDPTRGMAAMRVRILRAELLAGCMLSVFSSIDDGEEAVVAQGSDAQPRTTSTGAILSVTVSAEQNNTLSRAIRMEGKVFISRDGPNHPLYPSAHRVRLHPRVRITNAPTTLPTVIRDEEEPHVVAPVLKEDVGKSSVFENVKTALRRMSTVVASGAAWISMANGARTGSLSTTTSFLGMVFLLGSSELADYPIVSTVWNASAPLIHHASNITFDRLTSAADLATEGVMTSEKFVAWWLAGIIIVIIGSWMCVIWTCEYMVNRTRRIGSSQKPPPYSTR